MAHTMTPPAGQPDMGTTPLTPPVDGTTTR